MKRIFLALSIALLIAVPAASATAAHTGSATTVTKGHANDGHEKVTPSRKRKKHKMDEKGQKGEKHKAKHSEKRKGVRRA
jgi:hypothetical protein